MPVGTSRFARTLLAALAATAIAGCAGDGSWSQSDASAGSFLAGPLKVGVSPNYAPVIMQEDGRLLGVEVDLAEAVAKAMNRDLELVELLREEQIPALRDGRIQVIMSGLSITRERAAEVAFADPYLKPAQMALIRMGVLSTLGTAAALGTTSKRVEVQ